MNITRYEYLQYILYLYTRRLNRQSFYGELLINAEILGGNSSVSYNL